MTVGSIFIFLLILALVGVIAWALNTYLPTPSIIKTIIWVAAVVIDILIVANHFNIFNIKV